MSLGRVGFGNLRAKFRSSIGTKRRAPIIYNVSDIFCREMIRRTDDFSTGLYLDKSIKSLSKNRLVSRNNLFTILNLVCILYVLFFINYALLKIELNIEIS